MQNYNNIELLEKLAANNILAFEEIYNRYSKDMFFFAMNVFKEKEVCEDVIQNVFIDFWSKRKTLKIVNLKAYLFQSVKYQIFNHIRNKKLSFHDLSRFNIIDLSNNISENLEFKELQEIIEEQVLELPSRCRQIFLLSRYEHKSNREIAALLGISIQAVKNQISKAINAIRQNLRSQEIIYHFLFLSSQLLDTV